MVGRGLLLLALTILVSTTPVRAESVYWNYGVASIEVGYSSSRREPIGYKISFVGIGPDNASRRLQNCIRDATIAAGESTWKPLDREIKDLPAVSARLLQSQASVTRDQLKAAHVAEVEKTGIMVAVAEDIFRGHVANCAGPQASQDVSLAMVNRLCVSWSPQACKKARGPSDPRTNRYPKVYDWMLLNKVAAPLNVIRQLVPYGGESREILPDLRDRAYLTAPSTEETQRQFEEGVARFRQLGIKYNYAAPGAIALDRSVAIRLLDGIGHPAFSIPTLKDERKKLLSLQDELARSRIRECILYGGKLSVAEATSCSGYNVDVTSMGECLAGGQCRPDLGNSAQLAAALLMDPAASLNDLAKQAMLPRITGGRSLAELEQIAKTCGATDAEPVAVNKCVLRSVLTNADRATLDCIDQNGLRSGAQCVSHLLGNSAEAKMARCLLDNRDRRVGVLCAVSNSSPQAAAAYQCYQASNGNSTALTSCIAGNRLPPEARKPMECASQHPGDYKAIGGCIAASRIGGDAGRLSQCAVASGGDLIGTAACAAGGSLTPEQQILVQCASQSADLISFAACTGGQLSLREYIKCKNVGYGEGDCFGQNNAFRVFSRRLGLGDIHKDTVVGQVAGAQLALIKFQVAVAEGLIEGAGELIENAGQSVVQFAENVGSAIGDAAEELADAVEDLPCPINFANCPCPMNPANCSFIGVAVSADLANRPNVVAVRNPEATTGGNVLGALELPEVVNLPSVDPQGFAIPIFLPQVTPAMRNRR